MDDWLRDSVSHTKDVEGLCYLYRTSLYKNVRFVDGDKSRKCILPCTALSVVKILESLQVSVTSLPPGRRMSEKTVTIVNRSEIVGRPLAAMLANDGATVYSVDIDSIYTFSNGKLEKCTKTAEECVRESNVVVLGVPVKSYKIPTSWIKKDTTLVNVASFKNYDEKEILGVEGVKVVGMVGKVTVKMLERNLCRLHKQYHPSMTAKKGKTVEELVRETKTWAMVAAVAGVVAAVGVWGGGRGGGGCFVSQF